jgi:outer membrane protein OmpA-like peptidoglycan-associated protein
MRSTLVSFGSFLLASLLSTHAIADESALRRYHPSHLQLEAGVFGGVFLFSKDHNLQDLDVTAASENGHQELRPGADFGLRLAFFPVAYVGLEGEAGLTLSTSDEDGKSAPVIATRGHVVVQLPMFRIVPFVLGGLGALNIRSDDNSLGKDTDPGVHFGGGVKFAVTDYLAVRVDFRDTLAQKNRLLAGVADGDLVHNFEILAGVSYTRSFYEPSRPSTPIDSDGDGFFDEQDKCPREIGVAPDGCPPPKPEPDGDGDGIADSKDACPKDKEDGLPPSATDGCPAKDPDGDGIDASLDKCPTERGVAPDGCPIKDSDGDGFLDPADQCPDKPETKNGFQDTDGCPDDLPREVAKFTGVIYGIQFAPAKAVIRKPSRRVLDRAVAVLKNYPDLRLEISGHTDNKGTRDKNVALSQARADSVKAYLVSKGIDASRIQTRGAGPDEPIAPNKTKRGRTLNRRIEFKLLY